jgi:hypothetical protein
MPLIPGGGTRDTRTKRAFCRDVALQRQIKALG